MKRRDFNKIVSRLFSTLAVISGLSWISKLMEQKLGKRTRKVILDGNQIQGDIYAQSEFWVVKNSNDHKVFSRRCPHLGCTLQINGSNGQIFCPCHGSQFKLDGSYLKGPAKQDLKMLEHRFKENGAIEIELDA